jgi:hypothetical protein
MTLPDFLNYYKANHEKSPLHDYYSVLDAALLLMDIDDDSYLARLLKVNQYRKTHGAYNPDSTDIGIYTQDEYGILWPADYPAGIDEDLSLECECLQRLISQCETNHRDLVKIVNEYCWLCQRLQKSKLAVNKASTDPNQLSDPSTMKVASEYLLKWASANEPKAGIDFKAVSPKKSKKTSAQEDTGATHGNVEHNAKNREEILGAAVAVMIEHTRDCQYKNGTFAPSKIASEIERHAEKFWPEKKEAPLTTDTIARQISSWIQKLNQSDKSPGRRKM